ncbi:MAG: hypothetical protein ACI3Z8_03920 [Paludibacteraceae bacterium]
MKHLFFKGCVVAVALLTTHSVGATSYCHDQLSSNDGNSTITLTCEKISDGNYEMTIEGENLQGLGGTFYNPGAVDVRTKITSSTSTKIVINIDAASDPTFYTPLYVLMPGEVVFPTLDKIEWGSCGGAEKETIKPVMGEASLASVTHNTAVLNVAGTDKETEDGETIAVSKFQVVYGETKRILTATDGQITIDNLVSGTAYSFAIYAMDAVNNVSDNYATVEATTESLTYCDFPTGHEGNANFGDPNGRILLTLKLTAANKVQITVKPNTENGATQLLDYLYVAPSGAKAPTYTAGADITEGNGEASMSVEVEYEALPATMNFHLEWSNPAWDGRWAMDVNGVTADMLCSDKTTTMPAVATPAKSVQKRIENGMLIIYRDNKAYSILGTAL